MKFFMDHLGSPEWVVRRRIIILSLLWISGMVTYLAIWGRENSLSETIATSLILLFGSIVGSYVFGAVWDNKSSGPKRKPIDQIETPEFTGPYDPSIADEINRR